MNLKTILTSLAGLSVAAFMLYFPDIWVRWRKKNPRDFALEWYMGPGAWRDVIIALLVTLIPLTVIALHWPVEWGGPMPHHPSFWDALNNLGGGIAAAFIEETFYRGWIQTLTVQRWGAWRGIIFTTALFAASHLIVLSGVLRLATFFPGLVMAWLRHRNGSVLPGIIYHGLCNVWAVWMAPIP